MELWRAVRAHNGTVDAHKGRMVSDVPYFDEKQDPDPQSK
jgi:hypothetical protein